MRTLINLLLAAMIFTPSFAMAFDRWHRGGPRYYRGYPIVFYHGHYGYWVGSAWYPYEVPVYPAPVPVYAAPVPVAPTASVGVRVGPVAVGVTEPLAPPPAPVAVVAPPGPKVMYYCDNPAGYYPNVASCVSGWRQMAAP